MTQLLEKHYGRLVDYDFTASMEDDLDRIAAGEEQRVDWLTRFYKGTNGEPAAPGWPGLHAMVTDGLDEIDARAVNSIELPGSDVVVRVGRYGPYLERGEERASLPEDVVPDELTPARAEELLAAPGDARELGVHPKTGRPVLLRSGRYGPYATEEPPEGSDERPRTASLFSSMSPETLTLDDGVRLLSLPRVVGVADGEEVLAMNGQYGPFIKRGTETRSLEGEEQLFAIDLDQALALLAAPKTRRGEERPSRRSGSRRRSLVRASSRGQGRPIRSVRNGWGDDVSLRSGTRLNRSRSTGGSSYWPSDGRKGRRPSRAHGVGSSHPHRPPHLPTFPASHVLESSDPGRPEYVFTPTRCFLHSPLTEAS